MKDLSSFGRNEVLIPLTESVDSFLPALFINNEGMELGTTLQVEASTLTHSPATLQQSTHKGTDNA